MAPETLLWLCVSILPLLLLLLTVATQLHLRAYKSLPARRRVYRKRYGEDIGEDDATKHLAPAPRPPRVGKKIKKKSYNRHVTVEINCVTKSQAIHLHTPCSRCRIVNAKRDCRYMRCATCCRDNADSVCHAHGTGYTVAVRGVESAILYRLYQCDISYSNLHICPPNLSNIGRQLVTLNLSNNRLKFLPEDISRLSGLQELFLQYNHLPRLPAGVCCLTSLVELDVKNNQLTHLPEYLCNLRKLIVLNLTNNCLRHLPDRIGDLVNLQELSVHCNKLERLPNSFCQLTNLQMFYAGENRLHYLPNRFGQLTKLEELDLSGCELVMLPESISRCRSLVHVWLTGNKLATLPFMIGDLQKLNELHIRNNHIKFLPASIVRLNLYTFTAQNNCFLDEAAAVQASCSVSCGPPPLLELSARNVYRLKLFPSPDLIPSHLSRMLSPASLGGVLKYPLFCSGCGGPIFSYHYLAKFIFVTISVCYRVPIYHMYCSKKCVSSDNFK